MPWNVPNHQTPPKSPDIKIKVHPDGFVEVTPYPEQGGYVDWDTETNPVRQTHNPDHVDQNQRRNVHDDLRRKTAARIRMNRGKIF